jgi:hypothetical protein
VEQGSTGAYTSIDFTADDEGVPADRCGDNGAVLLVIADDSMLAIFNEVPSGVGPGVVEQAERFEFVTCALLCLIVSYKA